MRQLQIILIFTLCLGAWALPAQGGQRILLAPGHQKVLETPGITRAAIGNPEVADVKALHKTQQVIVTGKSNGSTDLIVWTQKGKKKTFSIHVTTRTRNQPGEIRTLLKGIEGIEIRDVGGQTIIDGQIYRGEDLDRIRSILEVYPQVVNLARVNSRALNFIAKQVESAMEAADLTGIQARPAGDNLFLEGQVSGPKEAERALSIAKTIYSSVTDHLSRGVEIEPLILVDVKMMEVRKNNLADIGLKWPSNSTLIASGSLRPNIFTGSLTLGSNTTATLHTLMEKGAAKMLANPRLLCRSGTPASFLAGGEIPIPLIGERTTSVTFKKYGILLNVTAQADQSNQVMLEIDAKVSDLDHANAIKDIPGTLENSVKTAANLRFGDTVVLAGLVENRSKKNVSKFPLLGSIPIIGELFKSRSFRNNETEFLMFLTPIPAGVGSSAHRHPIRAMQESLEETTEDIEFSLLD